MFSTWHIWNDSIHSLVIILRTLHFPIFDYNCAKMTATGQCIYISWIVDCDEYYDYGSDYNAHTISYKLRGIRIHIESTLLTLPFTLLWIVLCVRCTADWYACACVCALIWRWVIAHLELQNGAAAGIIFAGLTLRSPASNGWFIIKLYEYMYACTYALQRIHHPGS